MRNIGEYIKVYSCGLAIMNNRQLSRSDSMSLMHLL